MGLLGRSKPLVATLIVVAAILATTPYVTQVSADYYTLKVVTNKPLFAVFINGTFKGLYDTEALLRLRRGTYEVSLISVGTDWVNRTVVLNSNKVVKVGLGIGGYVSIKALIKGPTNYGGTVKACIFKNGRLSSTTFISNNSVLEMVPKLRSTLLGLGIEGGELVNYVVGPKEAREGRLIIKYKDLGLGLLKVVPVTSNVEDLRGGVKALVVNGKYVVVLKEYGGNYVVALRKGRYRVKLVVTPYCSDMSNCPQGITYMSDETTVNVAPGELREVVLKVRPTYARSMRFVIHAKYLGRRYLTYSNVFGLPTWAPGSTYLLDNKLVLINGEELALLTRSSDYALLRMDLSNLSRFNITLLSPTYGVKSVRTDVSPKSLQVRSEVVLSVKLGRVVFRGLRGYLGPSTYVLINGELVNTVPTSYLESQGMYLPRGRWCIKLLSMNWRTYTMYEVSKCLSIRGYDYLVIDSGNYTLRKYPYLSTSVTNSKFKYVSINLVGINYRSTYDLRALVLINGEPVAYKYLRGSKGVLSLVNAFIPANVSNSSVIKIKALVRDVRTGALYVGESEVTASGALLVNVRMRRVNGDLIIDLRSGGRDYRIYAVGNWVDGHFVGAVSGGYGSSTKYVLRGLSLGRHSVKLLVKVCRRYVCSLISREYLVSVGSGDNSLSVLVSSKDFNEALGRAKLVIKGKLGSRNLLMISKSGEARLCSTYLAREDITIDGLKLGDEVKIVSSNDTVVFKEINGDVVALGPTNYYTNWVRLSDLVNEVNLRSDYAYLLVNLGRRVKGEAVAIDSEGTVRSVSSKSYKAFGEYSNYLVIPVSAGYFRLLKLYITVSSHVLTPGGGREYYLVLSNKLLDPGKYYVIPRTSLRPATATLVVKPVSSVTGEPVYLELMALFINGTFVKAVTLVPNSINYVLLNLPINLTYRISIYSRNYELRNYVVKLVRDYQVVELPMRLRSGEVPTYVYLSEVVIDGSKYLEVVMSIEDSSPLKNVLPENVDLVINGEAYVMSKYSGGSWVALIPTKLLRKGINHLVITAGDVKLHERTFTLSSTEVVTEFSRYLVRVGEGVKVRVKVFNASEPLSRYSLVITYVSTSSNVSNYLAYVTELSSSELLINWVPKEAGIYVVTTKLLKDGELISKYVSRELIVVPKDETTLLKFIPEVAGNALVIDGLAYVPWGNEVRVKVFINNSLVHEGVVKGYVFKYSVRVGRGSTYVVRVEYVVDGESVATEEAIVRVK